MVKKGEVGRRSASACWSRVVKKGEVGRRSASACWSRVVKKGVFDAASKH